MRYVQANKEPHRALLDGIRSNGKPVITSPQGSVYIYQRTNNAAGAAYAIRDNTNALDPFVTSMRVSDLDTVFNQRLLKQLGHMGELRMQLTDFATDSQEGALDPTMSTYAQVQAMLQMPAISLVSVDKAIAQAQKEHARLTRDYEVSFDLMSDKELRENRLARKQLAKDIADMERKKDEAKATVEDVLAIEKLLQGGSAAWKELPLENQRRFIRLVTKFIVLEELDGDWLKLTVRWSPYPGVSFADVGLIYRQNAGKAWTERENMLLLRWYSKASRVYLLEKLPNRRWAAITTMANDRKLKRHTYENGTDIPRWLSVVDVGMLKKYGLTLEQPTPLCCWWLEAVNV